MARLCVAASSSRAAVRRLQARLVRITVAGLSRWDTSTPENLQTHFSVTCYIISQGLILLPTFPAGNS